MQTLRMHYVHMSFQILVHGVYTSSHPHLLMHLIQAYLQTHRKYHIQASFETLLHSSISNLQRNLSSIYDHRLTPRLLPHQRKLQAPRALILDTTTNKRPLHAASIPPRSTPLLPTLGRQVSLGSLGAKHPFSASATSAQPSGDLVAMA